MYTMLKIIVNEMWFVICAYISIQPVWYPFAIQPYVPAERGGVDVSAKPKVEDTGLTLTQDEVDQLELNRKCREYMKTSHW